MGAPGPLLAAFRALVPAGPADAAIEHAWCVATEAWPELVLAPERFAEWLAERCDGPNALAELDAAALYLTCACASGVPRAVEAFARAHTADIDLAMRRVGRIGAEADEVRQLVLEKLFRPGDEKIRGYAGRGSLSHWVRAVAARQAISAGRRRGVLERVDDAPGSQDPDVDDDPELAFLKAHSRSRFKAAFHAALERLDPDDRTILRLRFLDGLTLDQLARVRQVHRATVARTLARVRTELLAHTRRALAAEAGLAAEELDSLVRLVATNLDLSLPRLLKRS